MVDDGTVGGQTVTLDFSGLSSNTYAQAAGQVGGEPIPSGQEFTYTVRAEGRLQSAEDFEQIIVRANEDGSYIRVKDVARVELGAQNYMMKGRLNGKPAAILAIYQLAGTNAIQTDRKSTRLNSSHRT